MFKVVESTTLDSITSPAIHALLGGGGTPALAVKLSALGEQLARNALRVTTTANILEMLYGFGGKRYRIFILGEELL